MSAPNRSQREVIDFPPNQPVTVALKYNQGRKVNGQYGERMMFTTTDDRIFFTDIPLAAQIEAAGINVRENFTITLRWDGAKGSPRTWEVARIASITPGEQPNGTFAVPALPKPPASATSAERTPAERLVAESKTLIDAYAAVLEHALTTHNGRVKPEEVKSIFLTCVIGGGKNRAA